MVLSYSRDPFCSFTTSMDLATFWDCHRRAFDSYAAGQGAGGYADGCLQSAYDNPALIDSVERVHLRVDASCTGAATSDVISRQISALNRGTRLVTLTVGRNDLNVARVAAACTAGTPADCQAAIGYALQLLATPPGGSSELPGDCRPPIGRWQRRHRGR